MGIRRHLKAHPVGRTGTFIDTQIVSGIISNTGRICATLFASGAKNSQHLKGTAADIVVKGITPERVAKYAETLLPKSGGIGRYKTFTHVDVRSVKSRWNG
jgi:uncharacterized protein YcbK (DUF882 family)